MTFERINIMGNTNDDDYGQVIVPGQSPEMPADEDIGEHPEMGEEKPEVQIEPPAKEEKTPRLPPPSPEEGEKNINHSRKSRLPN